MLNKDAIKSLILSLLAMGVVSALSLVALSFLTYTLKWYAPQAMMGITVIYILTGVIGGALQDCLEYGCLAKRFQTELPTLQQRMIKGAILGTAYTAILFGLAMLLADGATVEYSRWLSIWMLLACSSIFGHFLMGIFYKKH